MKFKVIRCEFPTTLEIDAYSFYMTETGAVFTNSCGTPLAYYNNVKSITPVTEKAEGLING